jgi:hypothetical protein
VNQLEELGDAIIRAATEADAEAIYQLLFAAREEIPLSKIATDPKEVCLDFIRSWCEYNRSLAAELDGEVVGVMIVTPRRCSSTGDGEVVLSEWELRYGTIRKEYRGKLWFEGEHLFDALFLKAVEPFEIIYAEVLPGNKSEMAKKLRRWGFTEETRCENGTVKFKLARDRG